MYFIYTFKEILKRVNRLQQTVKGIHSKNKQISKHKTGGEDEILFSPHKHVISDKFLKNLSWPQFSHVKNG